MSNYTGKYIEFREIDNSPRKTRQFELYSIMNGAYLGRILFYPQWRKYIFAPMENSMFDAICLSEIRDQIWNLMDERKNVE